MANREVNLTKRVQTPHGMRYCRVVLSANGRVRPDLVVVNGRQEAHKEGAYYLEWREGSKRVRLSVGKDPADASARRQRKEAELNAVNNGVSVVPDGQNGNRSIAAAVADFLDETKLTKKPKTLAAYSTALAYFVESCHKLNLEELDKLFAKCDAEERLWYEFFLMTGEREQEVMYTYWSDVNFTASTVRVSHKPDRGWTPKAYKEREIPIPTKLVRSLKAWKAKSDKTCNLVFPTAGCNPKLDFLDGLKAVAGRAKLDKENFWLHKFRATFATWSLWAGVDLRTVQQWLGHSDMESTMRYLKPSRSQQTREKVNEIFA